MTHEARAVPFHGVVVVGPPKKIKGPPLVAKSQTCLPAYLPTDFFSLKKKSFWAFLGKGISKTPLKYFCKKSMSKTFCKDID
jgi:hypothetical protein